MAFNQLAAAWKPQAGPPRGTEAAEQFKRDRAVAYAAWMAQHE
ncbi:MAG: hypothetical protein AB7U20_11630 [Planctomycetaceae bacterium]